MNLDDLFSDHPPAAPEGNNSRQVQGSPSSTASQPIGQADDLLCSGRRDAELPSTSVDDLFGVGPNKRDAELPSTSVDDVFGSSGRRDQDSTSVSDVAGSPFASERHVDPFALPPDNPAASTSSANDLANQTSEELLLLIQEEEDQHERAMTELNMKCERVSQATRDVEAALTVKLPEMVRRQDEAEVAGATSTSAAAPSPGTESSTQAFGFAAFQSCLRSLQQLGKERGAEARNILSQVEAAAKSSLRRRSDGTWQVAEGERCTSSVILFHNTIKGMKSWATAHRRMCTKCMRTAAQMCPNGHYPRGVEGGSGLGLMPQLQGVPNKYGYRLIARLSATDSLRKRRDTAASTLTMMRLSVTMRAVYTSGFQHDEFTLQLENMINQWLNRAKSKVVNDLKSLWKPDGDTNAADLYSVIELFIHTLQLSVQVNPQQETSASHRRSEGDTVSFTLIFSVETPLHVSAITPLLAVLKNPSRRHILLHSLVRPIVAAFTDETTAVNSVNTFEMCLDTADSMQTASGSSAVRWFPILLSLAVFGTSAHVELAVPKEEVPKCSSGKAEDTRSIGQRLTSWCFHVARSAIHFLSPPAPPVSDLTVDPKMVDAAVAMRVIPTSIMRIFAGKFMTSSEPSMLDFFVSAQTRADIGLRLLSELCVDVYRPYHPSTGVRVARSGLMMLGDSSCLPQVVQSEAESKANLAVVGAYHMLREALENTFKKSEAMMAYLESQKRMQDALQENAIIQELKNDYLMFGVTELSWSTTQADVLLLTHQFDANASAASELDPLLYARVVVSKTN